jgi:small-conductance mechanosensitive channel/CRP-like cAMP-binding protein
MGSIADRLQEIDLFWPAVLAVALLVLLAGLGRRLARERRRKTIIPAVFLVVAFLLHVTAGLVEPGAARALHFATALGLALAVTGLLNVIVFDVVLHRRHVPSTLRDVVQAFAFFVLMLVVLRRSGVDPFSLLTTSAVLTAVIGLALQNTIANLFAGLALSIERRLTIGDWIRIDDKLGRVREITWRATSLHTKDGNLLVVPNARLMTSDVLNYSKPTAATRLVVPLSVAYRHPPGEVQRVLVGALRGVPGVLEQPAPDCFPVEFGDSAVVYALRFWTTDYDRSEPIEGEVRARVWYALERAAMEIPLPYRTIIDATPTAEARAAGAAREEAQKAEAVAAVDLFRALSADEHRQLAAAMRAVRFAANEAIIHEGDDGDSMYLVARGRVSVLVGLDGARREIATLGPGEFFGEMSLVTGERRQATCVATGEVECWVLDQAAVRPLLAARPEMADELSAVLAARQEELDGEREGLSDQLRGRQPRMQRGALLRRIRSFFQIEGRGIRR